MLNLFFSLVDQHRWSAANLRVGDMVAIMPGDMFSLPDSDPLDNEPVMPFHVVIAQVVDVCTYKKLRCCLLPAAALQPEQFRLLVACYLNHLSLKKK